jgi:hypothetical protein
VGERPDDGDDGMLDVRVSDRERDDVVDVLREQAGIGRLTLGEFEERLDEVYSAKTRRDLRQALRELPVEPLLPAVTAPSGGSSPEVREDDLSDSALRRRYRARMRNDLSGFLVPNFVCNMIWIMGDAGYWWPGWVLLGTGAGIIGTLARGFDPEKERAALLAERRKAAMAEIEARHVGESDRRQGGHGGHGDPPHSSSSSSG